MSTPTAPKGPCDWGDKASVSTVNRTTGLVATCWLIPLMGSTQPHLGSGSISDITSVGTCVRACVRAVCTIGLCLMCTVPFTEIITLMES